jgi:hypothetical protein
MKKITLPAKKYSLHVHHTNRKSTTAHFITLPFSGENDEEESHIVYVYYNPGNSKIQYN